MELDLKQLEAINNKMPDLSYPYYIVGESLEHGALESFILDDMSEYAQALKDLAKAKESLSKKIQTIYDKAKAGIQKQEQDIKKMLDNIDNSSELKELAKEYKAALKDLDSHYKERKKEIADEAKDKLEEAKKLYEDTIAEIKEEQIDQESEEEDQYKADSAELTKEYEQNLATTKQEIAKNSDGILKEKIITVLEDAYEKFSDLDGMDLPQIHFDDSLPVETLVKKLDDLHKETTKALESFEKEQHAELEKTLQASRHDAEVSITKTMQDVHNDLETVLGSSDLKQVVDVMQHKKKDVPNAGSLEDVPQVGAILDGIHKLKPAFEKAAHDGKESSLEAAKKVWIDVYKKTVIVSLWIEYWIDVLSGGKGDTSKLHKGAIKVESTNLSDKESIVKVVDSLLVLGS